MRENVLKWAVVLPLLAGAAMAVRAEEVPATATVGNGGAREATPAVPGETITLLQKEVEELQRESGPYDPQLGEHLATLGLAYQRNGEYERAVETLNRALQIKRVNEGLHNLTHVPILENLIRSNIATQDWDELDRNYQLLLWIHRRNYDVGDPHFLPIVEQMGRWKLQAYKEDLLKQNPETTLREADDLFRTTVNLLEEQYGETDPRLVEPLYGEAVVNYELMRQEAQRPLDSFDRGGFSNVTYQQRCFTVPTPSGPRISCTTIAVPDYRGYAQQQQLKDMSVAQRLSATKRSLRQIVEIYEAHPELSRESYAYALIHLADWHTFADQRGTARDHYQRAYELLAALENGEEKVKMVFGRPVSVPSLRLSVEEVDKQLQAENEQHYVKVSFDVSSTGRTSNVEILGSSDPENVSVRRKAKDLVRAAKFRPRFENGEPVDTIGVETNIPMRQLASS